MIYLGKNIRKKAITTKHATATFGSTKMSINAEPMIEMTDVKNIGKCVSKKFTNSRESATLAMMAESSLAFCFSFMMTFTASFA